MTDPSEEHRPPRGGRAWAGSTGSTWHSPIRAAAVTGSLGAAWTRGIPRTPLQLFSSDSHVCRRPPGHGLQPSRVSEMRHSAEGLLPAV